MSSVGYVSEIERFTIYHADSGSIHFTADQDLAVKCAAGSVGETTPRRGESVGSTVLIEMQVDGWPTDCVRLESDTRLADLDRAIVALTRVRDEIARMEKS